ncbi:hypothetical protein PG994_006515 [Apiospora phragmitis]|uniref:Uncharacterized protein n=1 Tax=Apiospora phragmitis TaxID=2905665 RepID=A0ABR1VF91_9PEZI
MGKTTTSPQAMALGEYPRREGRHDTEAVARAAERPEQPQQQHVDAQPVLARQLPEGAADGLYWVTEEDDAFHLTWGFTLYRTEYGGSSEQRWQALVAKIQAQVADKLAPRPESGGDGDGDDDEGRPETRAALLRLFRLDARSDPGLLQGKSMDEVRALFWDRVRANVPEPMPPQQCVFLLANKDVLGDDDAFAGGAGRDGDAVGQGGAGRLPGGRPSALEQQDGGAAVLWVDEDVGGRCARIMGPGRPPRTGVHCAPDDWGYASCHLGRR